MPKVATCKSAKARRGRSVGAELPGKKGCHWLGILATRYSPLRQSLWWAGMVTFQPAPCFYCAFHSIVCMLYAFYHTSRMCYESLIPHTRTHTHTHIHSLTHTYTLTHPLTHTHTPHIHQLQWHLGSHTRDDLNGIDTMIKRLLKKGSEQIVKQNEYYRVAIQQEIDDRLREERALQLRQFQPHYDPGLGMHASPSPYGFPEPEPTGGTRQQPRLSDSDFQGLEETFV